MKRILVLACVVAAILAMIFIGFDITKKEEQRIAINTRALCTLKIVINP